MANEGHPSARLLSVYWPAHDPRRNHRSGGTMWSGRRGRTTVLLIEDLERRTLLSVSSIMAATPSTTTPAAQETLNVQFQPGSSSALSQLTSELAAEGATLEATTVSGLYQVQVPGANGAQVALDLSASPAVSYADPEQTVQDLTVPNDPGYTNGTEWQLNGQWGINVPAPGASPPARMK